MLPISNASCPAVLCQTIVVNLHSTIKKFEIVVSDRYNNEKEISE